MTARDIYERYRIFPGLQLHQLRVAAVALQAARLLPFPVDERSVALAGLFHDMGNIIKAELGSIPGMFDEKDIGYWQGVKDEFVAKYGHDEHEATLAIAHEIGLPEECIALMENVGFGRLPELVADPSFEKKLVEYGDLRTSPQGVLSVRDRAEDGRRRYRARMLRQGKEPDGYFDTLIAGALELEEQIFARASGAPEDITDASVAPLVEELKTYRIA